MDNKISPRQAPSMTMASQLGCVYPQPFPTPRTLFERDYFFRRRQPRESPAPPQKSRGHCRRIAPCSLLLSGFSPSLRRPGGQGYGLLLVRKGSLRGLSDRAQSLLGHVGPQSGVSWLPAPEERKGSPSGGGRMMGLSLPGPLPARLKFGGEAQRGVVRP